MVRFIRTDESYGWTGVAAALAAATLLLCAGCCSPPQICRDFALSEGRYPPRLQPFFDTTDPPDFRRVCRSDGNRVEPAVIAMFAHDYDPRASGGQRMRVGSVSFASGGWFRQIGVGVAKLENRALGTQLREFRDDSRVLHFDVNCPVSGPTDAQKARQASESARLRVIPYPPRWGMDDAGIPPPALQGTGSPIRVGIVDAGIDCTHPDLRGSLVNYQTPDPPHRCTDSSGRSFVSTASFPDNCNDGNPPDCDGHGTKVAGIIAAYGDTVQGVDPAARLISFKVEEPIGDGRPVAVSEIVHAFLDTERWYTRILNVSVGWYDDYPEIAAAIDYVTHGRHAQLIVAAASQSLEAGIRSFPAQYTRCNTAVIGVAPITPPNASGQYTLVGEGDSDAQNLFAAGVGVLSTYSDGRQVGYRAGVGSSFAAPLVSGSAALVWRQREFRHCSAEGISAVLNCSARDSPIRDYGSRRRLQIGCLFGDRNSGACVQANECIRRAEAQYCSR